MTIYRKHKEVPTELSPARLYLDDIEQVVQIFLDSEKEDKDRSPLPEYVKPSEAEPKTTFAIRDYTHPVVGGRERIGVGPAEKR